jgi:hypothetical protein
MCVEKTRAYVKNNKKKLINGVVGWGRPVYTGEENAPLLNKIVESAKTSTPVAKKAAPRPSAKKSSGGGGKGPVAL